jgi:hypothetical protein
MSTSNEEQEPGTEVIIPQEDALPTSTRTGHGKMPEHIDDDMYEKAAEQERVAAGLADYAADDVPPATDPPTPGKLRGSRPPDVKQQGKGRQNRVTRAVLQSSS